MNTSRDLWKSNPQDQFSQTQEIHAMNTNVVIEFEIIKATKDKECEDWNHLDSVGSGNFSQALKHINF